MDQVRNYLPYRPRPHREESLQGFTLRLASRYGYKNHTTFAKNVFGWTLPRYLESESTPGIKWQEFLESVLRVKPGELDPGWALSAAPQRSLCSLKLISDVTVRPPRLCEHCVAQNGRFNKDWQIAHQLACEQHNSALLDCCPHCEKPFAWERSLFEGCKKCGYEWQITPSKSTSRYDLLVREQSTICTEALYNAYLYALNPAGHSIWFQNRIKFDPKIHHETMLTAYGLVLSEEFNEKVVLEFAGREAPDMSGIARQLAELRERRVCSLANYESARLPASMFLTDTYTQIDPEGLWSLVPPKHRKFSERRSANDLADSATVSELLGITIQGLNRLVDSGFIDCLGDTPVLRDRVYSLERLNSSVETFFEGAEKSEIPDTSLNLNRASRILRRFGFKTIDAVIWAFESKVPFWGSTTGDEFGALRNLHFDLAPLVAVCEEEFNNRSDDEVVTRKEAKDIICVSNKALDTVSKLGLLPSKRWTGSGALFDLATVRAFLSKYPTLGRQAGISGVTPKTMKSIHPKLFSDRQLISLPETASFKDRYNPSFERGAAP